MAAYSELLLSYYWHTWTPQPQQPNAVETLSQKGFTLTRLILLSAAAAAAEEIRHASL